MESDASRRFPALIAVMLCALTGTRVAHAGDGSNDVCPAVNAEADDVRERYDDQGRLVHQLRLLRRQVVEEVAIAYQGEHPTARTEVSAGHLRVARTNWDGDHVVSAECYQDGVRTGLATYRYDGANLQAVEKEREGRREVARFFYDGDGALIRSELRDGDGKLLSMTRADRAAPRVPIRLNFSAGGSYQSDTELYDFTAGMGIHRQPKVQRYGSDPLDVGLDATFKFHRADGITSTDQTTVRFSADYRDILPRITLFTFTATQRNLPANLRLNLEFALLGVKFDIVPRGEYQLDVSFAPVWNYRSILTPSETGATSPETTSKLRGSLRVRAGLLRKTWSLVNTFEFLPTLFGNDVAQENDFWNRSVTRNTLTLDAALSGHVTFRQELKYTRDPAMRAQANCQNSSNPLCRGYAVAGMTSLVLKLEL